MTDNYNPEDFERLKQEVETLLHLIRKLEQNILDLQAKD